MELLKLLDLHTAKQHGEKEQMPRFHSLTVVWYDLGCKVNEKY